MAEKMTSATRDRIGRVGRKLVVSGAAAGAAAAVALGPSAPDAAALNINQQVYSAGPLLSVLPLVGVDTIVVPLGELPVVGDASLTLNLVPTQASSIDLYNTVNALGFNRRSGFGTPIWDRIVAETGINAGNFPMVIASGTGALNLVEAYRAQISSVKGVTGPGYTPFQPGPIVNSAQTLNTTNEALGFLNNPLRPNGGLQTRFAPILNIFGVDTTVPAAGYTQSTGIELNAATLDLTWAYSPMSDFPVTLNPFSILNSLAETLPINLLGGVSLKGVNLTTLGTNVAGVLGIINDFTSGLYGIPEGEGFYGTLLPNDLPILEPLRLPARILSAITGVDLGTPFADALQPAFKILVNIGYSDVVTPTDIANDPATYGDYQPYDRTYLTSGVQEPFLSVAPLTPAEWLKVPGDVVRALFAGFNAAFPHPTMGGRVSVTPPAAVASDVAAETAVSVPAASARSAHLSVKSASQSPRAASARQKAAPVASSNTAKREAAPKRASSRSGA